MINFTFEENANELNEETLMDMADEMASAATSFDRGGYEQFIQARELFRRSLHQYTLKIKR